MCCYQGCGLKKIKYGTGFTKRAYMDPVPAYKDLVQDPGKTKTKSLNLNYKDLLIAATRHQ